MAMRSMNPRILAKLIEGHKNVIGPLAEERERFYQKQACPRCAGKEHKKVADPRRMLVEGESLPRYQLSCLNCTCVWDPFTGMIEEMGNLALAYVPSVPLINRDD